MRSIYLITTLLLFFTTGQAQETIRMKLDGKERFVFDSARMNILNTQQNVLIGNSTGDSMTTGQQNVMIGSFAGSKNSSGQYNVMVGYSAGNANELGSFNTFLGQSAGTLNNDGFRNTFVGAISGISNTSGAHNTFLGSLAGQKNKLGSENTYVGHKSGALGESGNQNIALGSDALYHNMSGNNNIAIGHKALFNSKDQHENVAIGDSALYLSGTNATDPLHATGNVAIGPHALQNATTGFANVAIGDRAMLSSTTSWSNTAVGYKAMVFMDSGSHNVAIGEGAMNSNMSGSNNVAIGDDAMLLNTGSKNTAIGQSALSYSSSNGGNVAIGYRAGGAETGDNKLYIHNDSTAIGGSLIYGEFDNQLLRVNGALQIGQAYTFPTSDGSSNQVLHTDGSGLLTWQDQKSTLIKDVDGDTKIEALDFLLSDKIDFTVDNNNFLRLGANRIQFLNSNDNVILGGTGDAISGSSNTFLGIGTGTAANTGSNNIFLGANAGANEAGNSRLYVDVSATTTPLLYGEFNNDILRINGQGQAFSTNTSEPAFLGQYTGTTFADVAGVKGYSKPADNWGIGGTFEGGYIAIDGKVSPNGDQTYYGSRVSVEANLLTQMTGAKQYGSWNFVEGNGTNYGVFGLAKNGVTASGIDGFATGASTNYGVNGSANGDPFSPDSGTNYGVRGEAFFAATTYGVYGKASHTGVYGFATSDQAGPFPIIKTGVHGVASGTGTNYGGYFEGNSAAVYANGDVYYTGSLNNVSDIRVKKNVKGMSTALPIILSLQPKKYEFRSEEFQSMHLPEGEHYGFIAQEVDHILPTLVAKNAIPTNNIEEDQSSEYMMAVNYLELIPILTKAIQEQQYLIESLQDRIAQLEKE